MKFIQYLFFLFILLGCSVTKRVHLPGYHVEWKKNEKSLSKQNKFEVKSPTVKDEDHPEYAKIEHSPNATLTENFRMTIVKDPKENAIETFRSTDSKKSQNKPEQKIEKAHLKNVKIKTKAPFFIYIKDPEFIKKVGAVLMVIGAFLLLSVFFANLNLLSFANITIGNGGCLMFIAYLVLAGIGYLMILAFGVIPSLIIAFSLIFIGLVVLIIATFILKRRG